MCTMCVIYSIAICAIGTSYKLCVYNYELDYVPANDGSCFFTVNPYNHPSVVLIVL